MSDLEEQLAFQLRAIGTVTPVREFRFAPPRRFRFDFAWPSVKLACEVQGGVWTDGRHTRGGGAETDAEKLSLAAVAGWRVLVVTRTHIESGAALRWIEAALGG